MAPQIYSPFCAGMFNLLLATVVYLTSIWYDIVEIIAPFASRLHCYDFLLFSLINIFNTKDLKLNQYVIKTTDGTKYGLSVLKKDDGVFVLFLFVVEIRKGLCSLGLAVVIVGILPNDKPMLVKLRVAEISNFVTNVSYASER
eukprot:snap_masked-scaffold_4-processed-gene-9.19-mRNA-1 protein AED:1.00 eAED:1.00 QI:0/0/0/0/1/1/5/0/142